jgi:hypothetical protein
VAAVREHGQLHARRPSVVEERLYRGADRAAGVEDIVDEDARHPLERKLEGRRAHDRLRVPRRLAPAHLHVVAVEGDVELAERKLDARALGDQAAEPLGERHAAAVDADERDGVQVVVPLDHLVRDARECALDRLSVEDDLPCRHARLGQRAGRVAGVRPCSVIRAPFRPRWTGLKGNAAATLAPRPDEG